MNKTLFYWLAVESYFNKYIPISSMEINNVKTQKTAESQFAEDVFLGLSSDPKTLPSKYFYDEKGDKLFQKIMELEEYYLTECEYEILSKNKRCLEELFNSHEEGFELIELGAGDGYKTKLLLEHFASRKNNFHYYPIDISSNVLKEYVGTLEVEIPELKVKGICADYFKALEMLKKLSNKRKVILFLGANIGNFSSSECESFLNSLQEAISPGDILMIGFDLKKNPSVILNAYNDKSGVTRAFNFNLLARINKELGGNFNLKNFNHYPTYCPVTGDTKSFLVSNVEQSVKVEALDTSFDFKPWETIQTEVSKKYDISTIEILANETGFEIIENLFDDRRYFVNSVWRKI